MDCWFPTEIMMNILSHLPIKSIVRFRCVCKSWFRLFTGQSSDPYFSQLHIAQSTLANPNPILIQLQTYRENQVLCEYRFASDYTQIDNAIDLKNPEWNTDDIYGWGVGTQICGLSNGLVCLCREISGIMYIWNPITRDIINIPFPPYLFDKSINRNKSAVYGFGFCQTTKEYKVVVIIDSSLGSGMQKYDYQCHANVYTLGTNTWRAVEDNILFDIDTPLGKSFSIVVNGIHHWLSQQKSTHRGILISFDLEHEKLQEILLPKDVISNCDLHIAELSGMLAILCRVEENILIWVMKDYGVQDSWKKQFTLRRSQLPAPDWDLEPFGVANDGNIMMINLTVLLFLNLKKNTIIRTRTLFCRGEFLPTAFSFMWSLISPRYITVLKAITEDEDCG